MNELVSDIQDTLRYAIEENGATVRVAKDLPRVPCDRVRMAEVFQNLLSNALKFTNDRPPVISIGHEDADDASLFWVSDNGTGVEEKDHERIFQIFQQAQSRAGSDGTGVGLTICKRIVERHGGRIWVESAPGRGAKFCFTLPRQAAEQGVETDDGEDAAVGGGPS